MVIGASKVGIRISDVVVCVLVSSALDRWLESLSSQFIGICCFSADHEALRSNYVLQEKQTYIAITEYFQYLHII